MIDWSVGLPLMTSLTYGVAPAPGLFPHHIGPTRLTDSHSASISAHGRQQQLWNISPGFAEVSTGLWRREKRKVVDNMVHARGRTFLVVAALALSSRMLLVGSERGTGTGKKLTMNFRTISPTFCQMHDPLADSPEIKKKFPSDGRFIFPVLHPEPPACCLLEVQEPFNPMSDTYCGDGAPTVIYEIFSAGFGCRRRISTRKKVPHAGPTDGRPESKQSAAALGDVPVGEVSQPNALPYFTSADRLQVHI
ncbi:hypothetical protein Bbelb_178920 [Branchiostoma belcheri]|nr:hypothetical protein Bbelb_178920 [Branchiostoma belcheri]